MAQTCSKCSRANPADAVYCYFDGFVLPSAARNGVAAPSRTRVFLSPFVFPGGRSCRGFDELALACQEEWAVARDLLAQGHLENFFSGLGRMDLVLAAREAARFPDRDRGLDQLLARLPTEVLDPPALKVSPADINLGLLSRDEYRRFELHLENAGMRLVYGTVDTSESWLALGEGTGVSQKHLQFTAEQLIPVQVRRDRLRAGKPQEARLVVESNAGTFVVTVRAELPVKVFPTGCLAGARSPRQLAEKAKANPREAALLFEQGAVAVWYQDNGWTYPVRGPAASGIGAVQQFFEALGLTPPPRVQISEQSVALHGIPGERIRHVLEVRSDEKRPVYAHGVSSQPWLEVGRAKLNGRVATLPLVIPSVPDRPGETLTAKLSVRSNGNQRFEVPVTLAVGGLFDFTSPTPGSAAQRALAPPDAPPAPAPAVPPPLPLPPAGAAPTGLARWVHLAPAVLLVAVLVGLVALDFFRPAQRSVGIPHRAGPGLDYEVADKELYLEPVHNNLPGRSTTYRFGLVLPRESDPQNPKEHKRLTYQVNGATNNTCVIIDGNDSLYGQPPGHNETPPVENRDRHYWATSWRFPDNVLVTQEVQIVPGAVSDKLDTCLVQYTVQNRSNQDHQVGLRVMFDTYIGSNDGVPFVIPGQTGLVTTPRVFQDREIPDYIEALERPDPRDPGTVAHLGLAGIHVPGITFEPIDRVVIRSFPGWNFRWDEPMTKEEQLKPIEDSCVFLYWAERTMRPGDTRHMAFSYGLNAISAPDEGGNLALTAGGSFVVDHDFTVTAYVKNPRPGEKVKLSVPEGLTLLDGQSAEQQVKGGGRYTQVSWRLHSTQEGEFTLSATSRGARVAHKVRITRGSLFR
jgi:hypothetical protein